MELKYHGTKSLKEGFVYPSLYDYIEKTKQEIIKPLNAPEYAVAGEKERLRSVSEKAQPNPYQSRAAFSDQMKKEIALCMQTLCARIEKYRHSCFWIFCVYSFSWT